MLRQDRKGCPRLRTWTSPGGPSQAGPEHRTNTVFIKKLTRTPKPAQSLAALSKLTNISSPGLPITGMQIPLTQTDKRFTSMVRDEKLHHNSANCNALFLTHPHGKGWCLQSQGPDQEKPDSPPSLGLAKMPWKEPQQGQKPASWVQLCQGHAEIPAESLGVSGLLFLICKIGSLGKTVSKTPSSPDTKQS